MKVLHINCNYIGTTLHQTMIENLNRLGIDNSVYVSTYDRNLSTIQVKDYVKVEECFHKWDRLLFDYKQNKIRNSLQKVYDVKSYNLIHAYTLFTDGSCARMMSQKYGIPYVVAVRNTDVNNFFRLMPHLRGRGVQIMREAAAVFFLSETYHKQVLDKYVPDKYNKEIESKIHIIPNGIDDFWLDNPSVIEKVMGKSIKLIYAGRIDKNKNIPTIQKAMKILRDKGYDITLTVVGKIADQKEFALIEEDGYTTYKRAKPKEVLLQLYREHDVFVMPSHTETFGLVYAEALSQGLPVIYTKGQGFDGQFPEGMVGYSVISSSAEDIAEKLCMICERYAEISKNAVKRAETFRWSNIVKRYCDIYKEICHGMDGV